MRNLPEDFIPMTLYERVMSELADETLERLRAGFEGRKKKRKKKRKKNDSYSDENGFPVVARGRPKTGLPSLAFKGPGSFGPVSAVPGIMRHS